MPTPKTALVIGGSGLLGHGVTRELLDAKYVVSILARGKTHATPAVPGVAFIEADRTDEAAFKAALASHKFDLVVDCAAFHEPDVALAARLLASRCGHYVFISTDFVYAYDPAASYPTREEDTKAAPGPGTPAYALGKLQCENALLRIFDDARFPLTILRPPHIVGAGKPLGCDPILGRAENLLQLIASGQGVPLLLEGKMLIQPVYSREVGRCIAHLAGNTRAMGQIFNIAGPQCVTVSHYYRLIATALNTRLSITSHSLAQYLSQNPEKSPFCRHRVYDLSHLQRLTGYTPYYPLAEGIGETIAWMQRSNVTV